MRCMIPPVEERQIRPCYSTDELKRCVHCIMDEMGDIHCNFDMTGESGYAKILNNAVMPNFREIRIKRTYLAEDKLHEVPCIYHLNKKEYTESMIGY